MKNGNNNYMPRLDNCLEMQENINLETIKLFLPKWQELFQEYKLELVSPYSFYEILDNPHPKDEQDDFILVPREAQASIKFSLKNIRHKNFDFEAILLNNKINITKSVYQYGEYCRDKLYELIIKQMNKQEDSFNYQSYKDWVDLKINSIDYRFIIHNYKIDQEDLLKINTKD